MTTGCLNCSNVYFFGKYSLYTGTKRKSSLCKIREGVDKEGRVIVRVSFSGWMTMTNEKMAKRGTARIMAGPYGLSRGRGQGSTRHKVLIHMARALCATGTDDRPRIFFTFADGINEKDK